MSQLAIDGGTPVKTTPFGSGRKWGWEELREIIDVFESGQYYRYGATKVDAFEREYAAKYGVKHAVASTSGTAAIHVAIGMLNPEPGSEIITGPITDFGSIAPILYQQCIPIFADTDPETFLMDPASIEASITTKTAAIMVIHLFGNPCDMDAVMDIAGRHRLPVIEDCSQAHWTTYQGRKCGAIGDIGAFSLQASKHITTGEGGMTITNNEALGERGAFFQDKGWARQAWGPRAYLFLAPNYRMTELHGAVGLAQLRKLESIVERRHRNGDLLTELIGEVPGVRPQQVTPGGEHTYWLYALAAQPNGPYAPEAFAQALGAEGVPAGVGYIGKPIFECAEACWDKETFGTSGLPYTLPQARPGIEYTEETCPATRDLLPRMVTTGMSEFYTEQDIREMATAIRKVALGLAAKAT
jgi:dTDP-4-amino-4,6-dideoxygalactose transaminase